MTSLFHFLPEYSFSQGAAGSGGGPSGQHGRMPRLWMDGQQGTELYCVLHPETHTKRQVTQHGLLGIGDKAVEIHCTVRKKIFCAGPTRAAKAEQKSPVPARQA